MFRVFLVLDWEGKLGTGKTEQGTNSCAACSWDSSVSSLEMSFWVLVPPWPPGPEVGMGGRDHVSMSLRILLILHHIENIFRDLYRLKSFPYLFTYSACLAKSCLTCVRRCVVRSGRAVEPGSSGLHLSSEASHAAWVCARSAFAFCAVRWTWLQHWLIGSFLRPRVATLSVCWVLCLWTWGSARVWELAVFSLEFLLAKWGGWFALGPVSVFSVPK